MLELQAIHTYRGRAQILRQVSLEVGDRESVVLVGRNGAGKTTTIDSIIGLLPLRSGKFTFQGQDISTLPPYRRARLGIGYAPEDSGLFPDLTVEENLQICRLLAKSSGRAAQESEANDRVYSVFPEVKQFTQRRGLFLSGGQKKMVAIARAMMLSPFILLLDEPFEGLAPVVVTRLIEAMIARMPIQKWSMNATSRNTGVHGTSKIAAIAGVGLPRLSVTGCQEEPPSVVFQTPDV